MASLNGILLPDNLFVVSTTLQMRSTGLIRTMKLTATDAHAIVVLNAIFNHYIINPFRVTGHLRFSDAFRDTMRDQ